MLFYYNEKANEFRLSILFLPLYYYVIKTMYCCALFWNFFYQRLYTIYHIVSIISFPRYFDSLIMKKPINLDNLLSYSHSTIVSLCITILSFLYLCSCPIYEIVLIIGILKYLNLLIIKN